MKIAPVLFLLSCFVPLAQPNITTYQYVGNEFLVESDTVTTTTEILTRITASFTFAEPIPAISIAGFFPFFVPGQSDLLSWSVSDGLRTLSGPDEEGIVDLYTDAQGSINHWTIAVGTYADPYGSYDFAINSWGPRTPCDAAYYGGPAAPGDPGCPADFTYNLVLGDYSTFVSSYGGGIGDAPGVWTSSTSTPEPGTMGMGLIGAAIFIGRYRFATNRRKMS